MFPTTFEVSSPNVKIKKHCQQSIQQYKLGPIYELFNVFVKNFKGMLSIYVMHYTLLHIKSKKFYKNEKYAG